MEADEKREGFRTTSVLRAIEFPRRILTSPDRLAPGKTATQKPQHRETRGCEVAAQLLELSF